MFVVGSGGLLPEALIRRGSIEKLAEPGESNLSRAGWKGELEIGADAIALAIGWVHGTLAGDDELVERLEPGLILGDGDWVCARIGS